MRGAAGACEHARLLVAPSLAPSGCDAAPPDDVLEALVRGRGLDGPAVHRLLGGHRALAPARRPLDVWRAGAWSALLDNVTDG